MVIINWNSEYYDALLLQKVCICIAKHQHTTLTQKHAKRNKIISEIVKNYFKEIYTENFSVFDDLKIKLGTRNFK